MSSRSGLSFEKLVVKVTERCPDLVRGGPLDSQRCIIGHGYILIPAQHQSHIVGPERIFLYAPLLPIVFIHYFTKKSTKGLVHYLCGFLCEIVN